MSQTTDKRTGTVSRTKKPLTKAQRSHIMSKIRGKDTKPEVRLRKALWHKRLRYRKNYRRLPGTPDIALTRQKIAIFVDGDFWHARGHEEHPGEQVKHNREYWVRHLTRNVEKAKEVNDALTEQGWLVLRFWESDINKSLSRILKQIYQYL